MRLRKAALLGCATALVACQSPDVGQPCAFNNSIDSIDPVPADYVATGVPVCENLVCIKSPQRQGAYCSKPCVSNSDCFQSDTGLVCRQLTLDQNAFATLPADVQSTYAAALGTIGLSSYCATPQQ